jgi:hypothetical protein
MGVAGGALVSNLVIVVSGAVVGVMAGLGVAGLADAIPGLIVLVKSEMCGALLENGRVKGTRHMQWLASYKFQVCCFYTGVGINRDVRMMRIMTGTTINDSVAAIYQVIAHRTHSGGLPGRVVTVLAGGLLCLAPGHDNLKYAILNGITVAVAAAYRVARIMRRSLRHKHRGIEQQCNQQHERINSLFCHKIPPPLNFMMITSGRYSS